MWNEAKLSVDVHHHPTLDLLIPREACANDGTDGHGSMTRSKQQFDNWPDDQSRLNWQVAHSLQQSRSTLQKADSWMWILLHFSGKWEDLCHQRRAVPPWSLHGNN